MATRRVGIIMNGVTGRMGLNQHLVRSIVAIRQQGGAALPGGERLLPDPILVGRNESKLRAVAEAHGIERVSTDLDACLTNPADSIYFDATLTSLRADHVRRAIAAGKHVYCEKPLATTTAEALDLLRLAHRRGVKHGIVQDKLFLPGIRKLRRLVDEGFFGRILSVRGEFGYWVFEGDEPPAQRPSWNYKKEEGGGIILDMFAHWRYLLDHTFGEVKAVQCTGATHIPARVDERGKRYAATADDAAYATFVLAGPAGDIVAQFNSSWAVRVYRDDLLQIQVDGTLGSAVAGLRSCKTQPRADTPRAVWNPDVPNPFAFYAQWREVPDEGPPDNAFKVQWEMFLRHVAADESFPHDFCEGAKGVQLAELGLQSWAERRWVEVPSLAPSPSLGESSPPDGTGLGWPGARELIRRSMSEARATGGRIACGAGTDHLMPGERVTLDDVAHAYEEQVGYVERHGGRVILMASRALARAARGPDDYRRVYGTILRQASRPVILHWLGDMFDPELAGYWGTRHVREAMHVCLGIIRDHRTKVDGIKISLLDAEREIEMRALLPDGVRMYTGDDLNYDRLILGDGGAGDGHRHSDALLGIFDAIAPAASAALQALDRGDVAGYRRALGPSVALSRHIFQPPTYAYKTGVVFLAYLNGHQTHFRMLGGAESWRSLPHLAELFRLADCAGLLVDPDRAAERMRRVLALAGVE